MLERSWLLAAIGLALAGCNDRPPVAKKEPVGHDAPVTQQVEPRWLDALQGATLVAGAGSLVFGEWDPSTYEAPVPRELRVLASADGAVAAADRGWLLRPARTAEASLVIDEGEQELSYVVRRLGEKTGTAVAPPDDAPWVIRAAVCGAEASHCALVRWSPRPGQKVAAGDVERLGITVIDAAALTVERQIVLELPDLHAGTATVGGVVANPKSPTIYVVERTGAKGPVAVQAIDLGTGKATWRHVLEEPPDQPIVARDLEMVISGDGRYLVVGRGDRRWGSFELEQLEILDAGSGVAMGSRLAPEGWRYLFLMPVPAQTEVLVARIGAIRGTGDSPTFSFLGVSRFDPQTGRTEDLYDPALGARTDDERDKARWKTPVRGVALDDGSVVLSPIGEPSEYAKDLTPVDRQQRRVAAVAALAELTSP